MHAVENNAVLGLVADLPEPEFARAPKPSADLNRIISIARRDVSEQDKINMAEIMRRRLARPPNPNCICKSQLGRDCITHLKPTQGWALYEVGIANGLLGMIVVGGGKTGLNLLTAMVLDGCKSVVLLVPAKLQHQLRDEFLLWRQHWYLPNLYFGGEGILQPPEFRRPGEHVLPTIHVLSYSKLSQAASTERLMILKPDTIICDEVDKLKRADSARTKRFTRYLDAAPTTRLCAWSGSLMNVSIKDFWHIAKYALKGNSPLPLTEATVDDWSASIDPPKPGDKRSPPGALVKLCDGQEGVNDAFRRRVLETRGVVATHTTGVDADLIMHRRDADLPLNIREELRKLRGSGLRPDDFPLEDAFSIARCARQLASGFYQRWRFPPVNGRKQDPVLIDDWYAKRKAWSGEVRTKLERDSRPHMDSPLLLAQAAQRFAEGYSGHAPTWESRSWSAWRDIRDRVVWEAEPIWLSDYLLHDAADWGETHRQIIWCEHVAFADRLAELTGFPLFGGGPKDKERLRRHKSGGPIILSRKAHYRGHDGLQYFYNEQLVANPPVSRTSGGAPLWEQMLGREHRQGQTAGTVETWIYRHTPELREAWDRAKVIARHVKNTLGSFQKINTCVETW